MIIIFRGVKEQYCFNLILFQGYCIWGLVILGGSPVPYLAVVGQNGCPWCTTDKTVGIYCSVTYNSLFFHAPPHSLTCFFLCTQLDLITSLGLECSLPPPPPWHVSQIRPKPLGTPPLPLGQTVHCPSPLVKSVCVG